MALDKLTMELITLKTYRYRLTKQQYKTFKGQILAGDLEGFRKGLFNVIKNTYVR